MKSSVQRDKLDQNQLCKILFAKSELEHLGHWVSCKGTQSVPKKADGMMLLQEPEPRKQLLGSIGVIDCCLDTWRQHSRVLAPLASLTSASVPQKWGALHPACHTRHALLRDVRASRMTIAHCKGASHSPPQLTLLMEDFSIRFQFV
jgi:hypothetical protein